MNAIHMRLNLQTQESRIKMDHKDAIECLDELVIIARESNDIGVSKYLSINNLIEDVKEVLQKQAFFESQVSHISTWFVDNKDCLLDTAMKVARDGFAENEVYNSIGEEDLDFIVEDIVDEIQKGILNVLSTYTD